MDYGLGSMSSSGQRQRLDLLPNVYMTHCCEFDPF